MNMTTDFKMDFAYYQNGSAGSVFSPIQELVKRRRLKRPRLDAFEQETSPIKDNFKAHNRLILSPDWRYLTSVNTRVEREAVEMTNKKIKQDIDQKNIKQEQLTSHVDASIFSNIIPLTEAEVTPQIFPPKLILDRSYNRLIEPQHASLEETCIFDHYTLTDESGVYTNDCVPEEFKNKYHFNYDDPLSARFSTLPHTNNDVNVENMFHPFYVRPSGQKDFIEFIEFATNAQYKNTSIDAFLMLGDENNHSLITPHTMRSTIKFNSWYHKELLSQNTRSLLYTIGEREEVAKHLTYLTEKLEKHFINNYSTFKNSCEPGVITDIMEMKDLSPLPKMLVGVSKKNDGKFLRLKETDETQFPRNAPETKFILTYENAAYTNYAVHLRDIGQLETIRAQKIVGNLWQGQRYLEQTPQQSVNAVTPPRDFTVRRSERETPLSL
jgi:hypothetical protein